MQRFVQALITVGLLVQSVMMDTFDVTVTEVEAAPATFSNANEAEDFARNTEKMFTIDCEPDDPECVSREELIAFCNQRKGELDGGRCFFSGAVTGASWSSGWIKCKSKGGTMAQVHTTIEFEKLKSVLLAAGADQSGVGQWIALRRDSTVNSGPYSMDLEKTFWYESETKHDPKLSVGNSWIQSHKEECPARDQSHCMVVWGPAMKYIGGDNICSREENGVACMKMTSAQRFKHVPKSCMTAKPIRSYKQLTNLDCARKCAKGAAWCRSFNFYSDGTCYLFNWVLEDRTDQASNAPTSVCKHYTYVN